MSNPLVAKVQTILGVTSDGIWGPNSQSALNREIKATTTSNSTLAKIQRLLGTNPDGQWGPISQQALLTAIQGVGGNGNGNGVFTATASSFADPADVVAFKKCKATGKTDQACFKVGDNGIGQFGKITAQNTVAMVALHSSDMIARWGSVNAAAHRVVNVTANGRTIQATVEDRLGVAGRIDLNPAAASQLGLNPPFLVKNCTWSWA